MPPLTRKLARALNDIERGLRAAERVLYEVQSQEMWVLAETRRLEGNKVTIPMGGWPDEAEAGYQPDIEALEDEMNGKDGD
jgi:hypothetical protein